MKFFLYSLQLIRINNLCIATLVVLLSAFLLPSYNHFDVIICILLVVLTMSFGYIMNDINDLEGDRINHPQRILVNKKVNIFKARLLAIVFLGLAIILTSYIHLQGKIIYYFCVLPMLVLYNTHFKKKPIIGNVIVSFLLASTFLFTEFIIMGSLKHLLVPAFLAFHLSFIREIFKDLHDYKGDLHTSMNTLPIMLGITKTCYFLSVYIILCCVGFLMPFIFKIYSHMYLISLIFFIEIPLIYSLLLLLKSQTIKTFRKMVILYKGLTICGLIVILSTKL